MSNLETYVNSVNLANSKPGHTATPSKLPLVILLGVLVLLFVLLGA